MRKTKGLDLKNIDIDILRIVSDYEPVSVSEIARLIDASRSWTWKRIMRLQEQGLVSVDKRAGVSIVKPNRIYRGLLRIGILRASEYPYIVPFYKRLRAEYPNVDIMVYDDAFTLASHLATGRIHLGMAPAITLLVFHRISGGRVEIIGGGSSGGAGVIYSREGGVGHSTTMASTMEMCAELKGLKGPRVYKASGDAILESVLRGEVEAGVVWEPYLYKAKNSGLEWDDCNLPFCCLLGANKMVEEHYNVISKAFREAVDTALRGLVDLKVYAGIVGLDYKLVRETVESYEFLREPPIKDLRRLLDLIKNTAIPSWVLDEAVRV
ncbi:MAG: winged helix-turn-helix transcriptional regulator [Desulfurococcales archaeon]|nr:winged helix-turn-helix transcriptional regulator [Desulfurococcales archaeon]